MTAEHSLQADNPMQRELEAAKAKLRSITADYNTIRKDHARLTKRAAAADMAAASANAKADALSAKLEATRNRSIMLEDRAKDTAAALADASKAAATAPETRANAHRYFEQLSATREQLKAANAALQNARKKIARLEHGIKVEVERTKALADKSQPLRDRNLTLEERAKSLAIRLKGTASKVELLNADNDRLRQAIAKLEAQEGVAISSVGDEIASTLDRIDKANEIAEARRETVLSLKDRLDIQNERVRKLHNLSPISSTMAFAEMTLEAVPESVDCLFTHGMQPLAVAAIAPPGRFQRVINDCIEIPSFHDRPNMDKFEPVVVDWMSRTLTSYLTETDTVLTVSDSLAEHLRKIGCGNVISMPNYRRAAEVASANAFRAEIGAPDEATVLLSVGLVTKGWNAIIEGVAASGENVYLASLGRILSKTYEDEINALISALGLTKRVHFLPPAPYDQLSAICAAADAGVIVLEPESVGNHAVALPNRLFDLLSGGTPIIAPQMPDVARIIEQFDCGVSIPETTASAWAQAISQIGIKGPKWREGAAKANATLTWESNLPILAKTFEGIRHVAIIGSSDLTMNNRTFRLTTDLLDMGIDVTIISKSEAGRGRFVAAGASVHAV